MNFITYDDFKKTDGYDKFIKSNPSLGKFKVQVSMGSGGVPVSGAEVLVTKDIDDKKVLFFKGNTNESGMIDDIKLPAPIGITDFSAQEFPKFTEYNLSVIDKENDTIRDYVVQALGDVKAIQSVNIVPKGGYYG